MKIIKTIIYLIFIYPVLSTSCFAYLGPGIAMGVLGGTFTIVIVILSFIFGLIWFPLRNLLKNKDNKKKIKKKLKKINIR